MTDLPAPPVPPDCDLRAFQYLPLDVVRLRDSELSAAASGDEFRAAVLLWCASWHQLPASSLPKEDRALAHLAGFGRDTKAWAKVRDGAMRGWYLADDGRLYHRVVSEKAAEAWKSRLEQRARTEAARQAREAKRKQFNQPSTDNVDHSTTDDAAHHVTGSVTDSVTEDVTGSKGEGREREGKGRDYINTPPPSPSSAAPARADAPAPPGGDGGARQRISVIDEQKARKAIEQGDPIGIVEAFGGKVTQDTRIEWLRDATGLQVGSLATVLWNAIRNRSPIRQPSGFRRARAEFEALTIDERRQIAAAAMSSLGVEAKPKSGPEAA